MKRKQILARAITLGLLLALPCGAWAETIEDEYKFSSSKTLTGDTTYTEGLLVAKDATIIGNNKSLNVQGFFYNKQSPDNPNFEDTKPGSAIKDEDIPYLNGGQWGLVNLGSINGVGILKICEEAGTFKNRGTITVAILDLEERWDDHHNDTNGVMVVDDIKGNFCSDDGYGEYYVSTFTNDGELTVNNSIKTNITNNGILYYSGAEAISGNLQNSGTMVVASGSLVLEYGELDLRGTSARIAGSNGANLNSLTVLDGNINIGLNKDNPQGNLVVDGIITARRINNYGNLKSDTLNIQGWLNEDTGLYLGIDNYRGATMSVNKAISLLNNVMVSNSGNILFTGADAIITGDGIINNISDNDGNGLIAKNADGDKITNLTIEGTLNNSGVVAAETLNVANGTDGSETQASKGFNVDNLNILDGGNFALNNAEYALQNVGVGANANLTAVGAVNGVETVALADVANFETKSLSISDGGVVTSDGGYLTTTAMSGESLTFNMQSDKAKQINVTEFSGSDLTINVASLTPEQVVIDKMTGSGIVINGNSAITDSFESDNIDAGLQSLADTASINKQDGDQSRKVTSPAGKILGATEAMTDANNKIIKSSVKEDVNPANQGISEMASITLMTWRQENNDMNKRLGELRDSAGEHGVWVRMTRGEAKYGNQNIKNQYNTYQLGYDEKLSSDKHWTVGAALTYTDAESSFSYGKGENKHKGLALYGSRLNDDGSFIDLIARYARLEHEYEVHGGAGKGDFDTNGYSLSAEYGKRFTQENGLWIEPQLELTYGKVSSGSYVTNNGVRVQQDGMDSLVGRLGFALGKNLAQGKGNVYLRASYLYDFDGETDVRYSYGQQNKRFEQDLGGGWWEVGVGANINLSEASHLYFDVEKTYGGDVATPWQWNAGVRWSF